MLIFGFLLILLAAGVIAYMVAATTGMPDVRLDYGILNLELPPLWLYLAGLLTLAVAALGFWMVGAGARLKARRAKEVRELKRANEILLATSSFFARELDPRLPW